MKKLLLLFLILMLAACTASPATEPGVPVTGDATSTSPVSNPQTGIVEANGITIAYESFGSPERETILLIAGTGQQLVGWPIEFVNALVERGYRVVRFDNRDIGLSTKLTEAGVPDAAAAGKALQEGTTPPIPYTLRDMAKDTVGLLDALGIEQAHLVGASMGGDIGQWVAIDYPERVLSLTIIAADSGNPKLPVIADPEAFADVPPQPTTADRDAFIAWQVKTFQVLAGSTYPPDEAILREWAERDFERGFDPAGFLRQQTAILVDHIAPSAERWNNLPNIKAPTLVIQGTEDPLVPMASSKDLAARIPNAELRAIPGLGHFIPPALMPEIADAVMTAVESTAQAPTAATNDLSGSSWQLTSFGPVGTTNPVIRNVTITLEIGEDGQTGGNSGCNSYGGSYTVQDDSLQFEEITSTLIACADQAVTEQEQQYLQALRTASRFSVEGDTLKIAYQNDGGELIFVRSSGATPEPPAGTMTNIPVTAISSPAELPERIEFDAGTASAQRSGLLPSGPGVKQYVLTGNGGQTMTIAIFSDGVPLSMTITMPNGSQRIPEMSPADTGGYQVGHEFTLSETGDYVVTLTKADHTPSTNYTADFTIK
jgi:pimeloyl-ACP methyl ester carboxylesterase/heat shock protein HslJ